MQYIGLTGSLSSGKLGGLVGTRNRSGNQFRARILPRQALTPSASEARAITGGLPALWRILTEAEQSTWTELATALTCTDRLGEPLTLSGYALYIACSRRLVTIGITQQLRAAPALPSIPPIYGFQAQPIYNPPGAEPGLSDILLATAQPLPPGFLPVLRASAALSPTRAHVDASRLRVIEAGTSWATQPHSALAPWLATYGTSPPGGTITFELSLVDPASGLIGAAVRAAPSYAYTPTPPPPAGTVTIQVEGITIAQIPGTYFQTEGETIAD